MTITTDRTRAVPPAVTELDRLAGHALARAEGDTTELQAVARRNLTDFMAANNVSMMGGWT